MKRAPLWQVSIISSPEADEAVAELLQRSLAQTPVSVSNLRTRRTTVSVYLEKRPDWRRLRPLLVRGLRQIQRHGLRTGPGRIVLRRIARERWAESWKRHFKPIEIGRALLIRPGWIRWRVRAGQQLIVLNPGLSFGTGQHPTTRFCLRQLVRRRRRDEPQSFLDVGTGSGILAIAAAKLGFDRVDAFDNDPEAVRVAGDNAKRNRVLNRIHIVKADLRESPLRQQKYDAICANLISPLLIAEGRRLVARLKPGGALIVAGILANEFQNVRRSLERLGLRRVASRVEKEWRSAVFERSKIFE